MAARKCLSDLSENPETVTGFGPLQCEVRGKHEWHERQDSPLGTVRWRDLPGGGREVRSSSAGRKPADARS